MPNQSNNQTNQAILQELVHSRGEHSRVLQEQQQQIIELVQSLKNGPPQSAKRKEQFQTLVFNFRKTNRLKQFKGNSESDIDLFFKKFHEELNTNKILVGLSSDLTRDEYVPLFRSCLEYAVVERVDQVLLAKNKTWDNVTIEQLKTFMKSEFGSRQTDVANVLKMWGPSRLTKRKDETAADHYFRFNQGFPECLKPVTDAEKDKYIDLMNRSMYFISLDDDYLQKEVSNIKTADPTIKTFFDEVVSAEARLNTYNDISKTTVSAEGSGSIAVSYANAKTGNKAEGNKTGAKQKEFVPKKNAKGENQNANQNKN